MDRKLKLEIEEVEERIAPAPMLSVNVPGQLPGAPSQALANATPAGGPTGAPIAVADAAFLANGRGPVTVTVC